MRSHGLGLFEISPDDIRAKKKRLNPKINPEKVTQNNTMIPVKTRKNKKTFKLGSSQDSLDDIENHRNPRINLFP